MNHLDISENQLWINGTLSSPTSDRDEHLSLLDCEAMEKTCFLTKSENAHILTVTKFHSSSYHQL